jgi:hypothetical protein
MESLEGGECGAEFVARLDASAGATESLSPAESGSGLLERHLEAGEPLHRGARRRVERVVGGDQTTAAIECRSRPGLVRMRSDALDQRRRFVRAVGADVRLGEVEGRVVEAECRLLGVRVDFSLEVADCFVDLAACQSEVAERDLRSIMPGP